jgi:hypothetical protein
MRAGWVLAGPRGVFLGHGLEKNALAYKTEAMAWRMEALA